MATYLVELCAALGRALVAERLAPAVDADCDARCSPTCRSRHLGRMSRPPIFESIDEPVRRPTRFLFALFLAVLMVSTGARAGNGASWQGTILCTTATVSGYRSFAVDERGSLAELTLRRAVAPGLQVAVEGASTAKDARSVSARTAGTVRVLRPTRAPFVVRSRLIENGYSHYRFYRNGRPWGCRVAFDERAAVAVAKLILSGRSAALTLTVRDARLVHLRPREEPLAAPARTAQAKADVEGFLVLLARGRSIAACATLSSDALLIHGGRDGCIMVFESAKFMYRERYRGASVERVALFDLDGDSYALATIKRSRESVRALFIFERGRYRYLGDLELSPIELW
jgi:hypothetical protein